MKVPNRFRIRKLFLMLATLGSAAAQSTQAVSGNISGLVLGPDGKPVQAATVSAVIVSQVRPRQNSKSVPLALSTASLGDGTFSIHNVPAGTYKVCAQILGQALLNTCTWGSGPTALIGAGIASASVPAMHFAAGATLHVRVSDLVGALQKGSTLALGIPTATGFLALPVVSSDVGGKDYQMLVPFDTNLSLMILARKLTLTDALGAGIDVAHQTIPLRFASGTVPATLNLRITGSI